MLIDALAGLEYSKEYMPEYFFMKDRDRKKYILYVMLGKPEDFEGPSVLRVQAMEGSLLSDFCDMNYKSNGCTEHFDNFPVELRHVPHGDPESQEQSILSEKDAVGSARITKPSLLIFWSDPENPFRAQFSSNYMTFFAEPDAVDHKTISFDLATFIENTKDWRSFQNRLLECEDRRRHFEATRKAALIRQQYMFERISPIAESLGLFATWEADMPDIVSVWKDEILLGRSNPNPKPKFPFNICCSNDKSDKYIRDRLREWSFDAGGELK